MTVKQYDEFGYKVIEFDSLLSHAEYLEPYKDDTSYREIREINSYGESSFRGAESMDDIITKMKFGDDKATSQLIGTLKEVTGEADVMTDIKMDIEGVAFDLGAVVSGEPECCINTGNPSPAKTLRILVDQGYSGGTSSNIINYRSAGIVNLINTLQAKGYILEVLIGGVYPDGRCMHLVKLNTENLCVSQLAVATSSGYWRCSGWATVEIMTDKRRTGGGDSSIMGEDMIEYYRSNGTFYIAGGYVDSKMNNLKSADDGTKYIASLFNDFCDSQVKGK